jgi:hypothetical protein
MSPPTSDDDHVIRLLALEDAEARTDRATLKRLEEWRLARTQIPTDLFRQRVANFLASMREVITALPDAYGDYSLDQIQISAEVSAKGQLSLLGSGGELSGRAGLTFTFNRLPPDPDAARPQA